VEFSYEKEITEGAEMHHVRGEGEGMKFQDTLTSLSPKGKDLEGK